MDKNMKYRIIQSESDVNAYIKKGEIGGLNFIYGNEAYLKLHYANKLANKAINADFRDFNLHKFDGKVTSVDTIAESIEAMPMFSEKSCVYVNDLPINDLNQTEIEKLKFVIKDIPETCVFIMLMDTIEKKTKKEKTNENEDHELENSEVTDVDKNEVSDKQIKENIWDEILTIAVENGHAIELNRKSNDELAGIIIKGAADRGRRIENLTAHYLIASVGNDLNNLKNELVKICLFSKNIIIDKKDIDAVAVKTLEAKVFDMAKLVLSNDLNGAFSILETLFSQKAEPAKVFGAFITPFIDMYRIKTALASGLNAIDVGKYYNYKGKEFRLTNLSRDVTGLSVKKLKNCINLLDNADFMLKKKSIDPKLVIEQTMVRIVCTINNT